MLLACDANCVRGAAASIQAVLDHTALSTPLRFYLMLDRVPAAQRERLFDTVRRAQRSAHIEEVAVDLDRVSHLTTSKLINRSSYARLLMGESLPAAVDRCIYLDSDLVMRRDIRELWDEDLEGHLIGAVPNTTDEEAAAHKRRLGLDDARYFNAGVLLVDLKRWRAEHVGARAIAFAERMRDDLILHDQDALNATLHHEWKRMAWHWNVWIVDPTLTDDARAVFHYMGAPKPWQADFDLRFRDHFFEALDRTPFAGWRPWNPFGVGARFTRARRSLPYLPGALRMLRSKLGGGPA